MGKDKFRSLLLMTEPGLSLHLLCPGGKDAVVMKSNATSLHGSQESVSILKCVLRS